MKVDLSNRETILETLQARKMAKSVHAYVRGNTAHFYQWLAKAPVARTIPLGPAIWIGGDCHIGNLGPVADANHAVDIQIRDLDQTVIGNPALDLIRLGLSLETAARSSDLPGVVTAHMVEAMIEGYARALTPALDDDLREPEVVRSVRRSAGGRRWRHLAHERIGGLDPHIPLGKRFWKLTLQERHAIDALFNDETVMTRAAELAGLTRSGAIRVVDAAYWRKGCSSLGKLRFAVLLGISQKKGEAERFALVDIKEAVASVVPSAAGARMPRDPAQRVVTGARALSPNLGERMIAARLLGKPVILRELAPQDLKVDVDQFSRKDAVRAARYLAFVIGIAHARQLDPNERDTWREEIERRDRTLDAPSWLWQSIVASAGAHETGYLEHCRRYAHDTGGSG